MGFLYGFLNWFQTFFGNMLEGILTFFKGIFYGFVQIFDFPYYYRLWKASSSDFGVADWILSVIAFILVFAVWVAFFYWLAIGIRKFFRYRRLVVSNEDLLEEIAQLHRDILRLNTEKDKIVELKVQQAGLSYEEMKKMLDDKIDEAKAEADQLSPTINNNVVVEKDENGNPLPVASDSRFQRLSAVDAKYIYFQPPEYDNNITLESLCEDIRNFACTNNHLYYEIRTIRLIIAGFAATKLVVLQGISGTGKTSLPYMMGKFFQNDATIASVQPSWRDRNELFGYFNEFTKKFNETEVLRRIYEAGYNDDMNIIILDEMNIARVEYYFAEMLSVLEMPDPNEWKLELVPSTLPNDPVKLESGCLKIPRNVWYIGTINNDDSTFSVSDKVYDRAFVINLDTKGVPFEAPKTPAKRVAYSYVDTLYQKAIAQYPVSDEVIENIGKLDNYVIEKFRIAFGNRIMKQLRAFVPCYVACGGTEIEGVDYILATKVFRKFESLNLSLIRDEIRPLLNFMAQLFGKGNMKDSFAYLQRLQKMY